MSSLFPRADECLPDGVVAPGRGTLHKYGLTPESWVAMCAAQGWTCPVCRQPFGGRKLVVDHAHVRGFKRMKPEARRLHVRGVLHSFCNRYVRGWLTIDRAASILEYLRAHEARLSRSKQCQSRR